MSPLFQEPAPAETLEGILERITFAAPDTGWSVIRLSVDGFADAVTAVGNIPGINIGESLRISGRWIDDRRYGRQFKIDSCIPLLPSTTAGIKKYLCSGVLPGIGPVTAARIVERFGADTLHVLDHKPHLLVEIKGLRHRAVEIARLWAEKRAVHEIMVFLQGLGLGGALAHRIHHRFGADSIQVVRTDPYRLAAEIAGIGFLTADRMARNLGIPLDAPERAQAGVMHLLREGAADGHTYMPKDALEEAAPKLLGPEGASVREAIDALAARHLAVVEGDAVYALPLFEAETQAARKLKRLLDEPPLGPRIDAERELAVFERKLSLTLAEGQRQAILSAINGKVLVITGGPGTGKTTLVRGIVDIFSRQAVQLSLCAPTGRAARRLQEATGQKASTIHRLLEFNPGRNEFNRHPGNPLDAHILIVDESSMLDIYLFRTLLDALRPSSRLVLVGDADQLPSVGPGSVLRDIIASRTVDVARLTHIFRQESQSAIVTNAHRILHGEMPEPGAEFEIVERDNPDAALDTIVDLATRTLPARLGISPASVQVLVPMHRGSLGSLSVNAALQERLNAAGATVAPSRSFRVGDKVMQVKNNYEYEVFNGDLGTLQSIDAGVITASFDGKNCRYDASTLDQLELAYACTIHKSQGSEYPAVVIALHTQHFPMLQRNLLYTAVTRGKRFVAVVGSKRALMTAVTNDRERLRWTRLAERLRD